MAAHELPSFELGNSLMVLVPSRDANGLPVFGDLLESRKSSLEAAGIKVPGSVDIARGFTMSRTVSSHDISFNALVTAFGRTDHAMPVQLLANGIGIAATGGWSITSQPEGAGSAQGTLFGTTPGGLKIEGGWSSAGRSNGISAASVDGSFQQAIQMSFDDVGNVHSTTWTRMTSSFVSSLGEQVSAWRDAPTGVRPEPQRTAATDGRAARRHLRVLLPGRAPLSRAPRSWCAPTTRASRLR